MSFIKILSTLCFAVSGIFSLTRQVQMLQQNSYFLSRYFKWVRKNYGFKSFLGLILACFLIILYAFSPINPLFDYILLAIGLISLLRIKSQINLQKSSIKPLVLTARVKRMYVTLTLVFIVIIALECIFSVSVPILFIYVLSLVPVCSCVAVSLINYLPEKAVAQYYIQSAKHILKKHGNLDVIGVTGSYGKTGTKFILSRILNEKFNTLTTPQSFNTPMGVVRTVRENLTSAYEEFICEMGAKNIGDIAEICKIAKPKNGIITSVGPQHLETFLNIKNVLKTKFELADACIKNGGKVYVNGDNKYIYDYVTQNPNPAFVLYGSKPEFSYRAENIHSDRFGLSFDLVLNNDKISVSTKLLGLFNVQNILAAAALSYDLGVAPKDIAFAINRLAPTEHRLELKPFLNGSLLIDDAYNANPEGSLQAVEVIKTFEGFKKIIVTPGLVELGEKEFECNYNLATACTKACDIIIAVGKARAIPFNQAVLDQGFNSKNYIVAESFAEALNILKGLTDEKTVVLFENDLPDNYR